jgi:PAT family acetyl-CoA transporter-like MFS transporter 1
MGDQELGEENLAKENQAEPAEEKSNLKGDYGNMALLLFLYLLQGTIAGLAMTIPLLLQNRGVSYKQQALFSISHYPFSCE